MPLTDYQLSLQPRFDSGDVKVSYYQSRYEFALRDALHEHNTYDDLRIGLYFCYLDLIIAKAETLVSEKLSRQISDYASRLHSSYAILKCYTMLDEILDICKNDSPSSSLFWYMVRNPLS